MRLDQMVGHSPMTTREVPLFPHKMLREEQKEEEDDAEDQEDRVKSTRSNFSLCRCSLNCNFTMH